MSGKADDKDKDKNKPGGDPGGAGGDDVGGDPGGTGDDEGSGDDDGDLSQEDLKKLVAKLRKENATHRAKNKSLEDSFTSVKGELGKVKAALNIKDDEEDPKTALSKLQAQNESQQMDLAISNLAIENGISKDQLKFFKFLLAEKFEELEEGVEISDDDISEVVQQVKGASSGKKQNSTGSDGKPPKPNTPAEVTAEQFASMTLAERTEVYDKNPTLYDQLMAKTRVIIGSRR